VRGAHVLLVDWTHQAGGQAARQPGPAGWLAGGLVSRPGWSAPQDDTIPRGRSATTRPQLIATDRRPTLSIHASLRSSTARTATSNFLPVAGVGRDPLVSLFYTSYRTLWCRRSQPSVDAPFHAVAASLLWNSLLLTFSHLHPYLFSVNA